MTGIRAWYLCCSAIFVLLTVTGCDEGDERLIASDFQGLWQGTVTDETNAETRPAEALVLSSGFWYLASYDPMADPINARPTGAVFGVAGGNENKFSGNGAAYTANNTRLTYTWAGDVVPRTSITGNYFKFSEGPSPAPVENGRVELAFNPEYAEQDNSLTGIYSNDELSIEIAADNLVAGQGAPGSQTGDCSFTGVMEAVGSDLNAFTGVVDLGDDADCVTGSADPNDDEFQVFAWLTQEPDCVTRTGNDIALVLGMHNGVIAHAYRRLCLV